MMLNERRPGFSPASRAKARPTSMTATLLLLAMIVTTSIAQAQAPVTFSEDFQSYGKSKKPQGWIDGKVGDLAAKPRGYYKTAFDPLGDKKGPNVVFGSHKSTGSEDDEKNGKRIGWMSTYADKAFSAAGRFELQGRLIEMKKEARIGLVVLSGYPEIDRYYLIVDRRNAQGTLTMQLTSFGAGTPAGTVDSNFVIEQGKWYRFRVVTDDVNNTTKIRARFWPDGTAEPSSYQIDATDASASRLKTGHLGMWAGGGKDNDDGKVDDEDQSRGVYIDDLTARSPSDTTPPVISFFESGTKLDPATTPAFNRDAKIEIRITDDLSTFTSTSLLDGNPYVSQTPVSAEGLHTLTVHAVDAPGNTSDATLEFLVDKTPPVIALAANGNPLVNGTIFNADVTLSATVQDISAVTTNATLNNNPVTLPLPVAEERNHQLVVLATDAAGNPATATGLFTLDKTAPVISIEANGSVLASGASFRENVTLTWIATDLTLDQVTATLDDAPIQSGTTVTIEGVHTLVVTAKDKAAHSTTESRTFYFARNAPEVTLLANGTAFEQDKTYNTAVRFTAVVHDPTPTTKVFTVDNNPYTENSPVTGDGAHTVKVVVTNAAQLSSTVGPFNFLIDTTPPSITMTESGQPFPDNAKFTRDVAPIVTATDNLTPNPAIVVTLDGTTYPTNAPVTEEKREHVINATATDNGGNSASVGPFHFMLDKTKPVVTIVNAATGQPFPGSALFNTAVSVKVTVDDITHTTDVATLDGNAFNLGPPATQPDGSIVYTPAAISTEGNHTLSVVATDEVGLSNDPVAASFVIDMTPPSITFTEPTFDATVGTLTITVAGSADDAVAITINGHDAEVNTASKTFTIENVTLLEGPNDLVADAVDAAGNHGTKTHKVNLDTRVPELSITTPAAEACADTMLLQVTGRASDPHLASVKVTVGAADPVAATIDAAEGTWSAVIPVADEGKKLITVEATDSGGHSTSASRSIVIDRTPPSIEVRNSGEPFTTTLTNRAVALFVRASDADPNVAVSSRLDGAAYTNGTSIATEGTHTLVVTATDCAGHASQKSVEFTIDLTPPAIRDLNPANGATVRTMPASISGKTDTDAASVDVSGTLLRATPAADGSFTIANVPFAEGTNQFTLIASDRAGNHSSLAYAVIAKTLPPVIEILESGVPIPPGALFNRAVTPIIRSPDPLVTFTATLDGAPFVSGTTIPNDGDYNVKAIPNGVQDPTPTQATFTIDRTPPVVHITEPASETVQTDHVTVRGTAGDSIAASVNGQPVSLGPDGSFVVDSFLLEVGANAITATGRDRAGNTGRDEVIVTRDDLSQGILLTYPPDRSLTNRPATDVLGRVINPARGAIATISGNTIAVDSTGAFRLSGYTLVEGENTITATTTAANGVQSSASTRVTADLTPPSLSILESGQALTDGVRFAEKAVITLQAADAGGGSVTTELTIDGTKITSQPVTITAVGGHSVLATARDLAGNETRAERTFFIGTSTGGGVCTLESFDPADGAVILSSTATLVGRSGGAIGVKVNGVAAIVADGAFCATVELPVEGANAVAIECTDANGNPTGTPKTITLQRITGNPSLTIDTPAEDFVSAQESIAVSGTVGAGVVSADVNGVAAAITGTDSSVPRPFTVPAVRLASGLNILVAHGRNAAGRVATASRRGVFLKDAPAINISAPTASSLTGIPAITVSGTYSGLDPTTLTVTNLSTSQSSAVQFVRAGDTTGRFTAAGVPLVSGDQTLRVTGRDRLNRAATASVVVQLVAGAPGIVIVEPANQTSFGGGSDSVTVSGAFQAAAGAAVDVNGVAATINGSSYSASVKFSTFAGGITPIVARVVEPDGDSAFATIVVTQTADAPAVLESFPAPNAVEVDSGALLLVLFSQPMDGATLASAFRLADGGGTPVSGMTYVDKDVLTFAPASQLTSGGVYTLRVTTAAKNLAGTALATEYTSSFTVGTIAPSTAPILTPAGSAVCGQSITVNGTATPGARVRLESGTLMLNGAADAAGKFTFTYPLSGQSGFAVVRVRVVGSDGSVSPAAELKIRIDCNGPQVLNASYDRAVNRLTIQFSEPVDAATASAAGSIALTLEDGHAVANTVSVSQSIATVTPAEDLAAKTFSLNVTTAIEDLVGNRLVAAYAQLFSIAGDQPVAGDGSGFISGEVYDATTGRPLTGASMTIEVPSGTPVTTSTDARGRYLARLREGAHTIKAARDGYTTVWREIIVPAGAGVIPIDIRLTRRGDAKTSDGSAMSLTHGGDTAVAKKIDLTIPAGALDTGNKLSLTSVGAQALTGLLPLGWSPMASAEIAIDSSPSISGQITFNVPAAEVTSAAQNLTAVQYDSARDEWRVIVAVVNAGSDGNAVVPISSSGAYALVYPDKAPGLTPPPLPTAGDVLRGVPPAPETAPALVKRDFTLDPPVVLPSGRAVATLRVEGAGVSFPSGTAVQAYIDEELKLADGSSLLDPPFATDLLLYRTLTGELGVADFHLAPSERAVQVVLETGVDHIHVFPYPGRLDRGTLIGSEGGPVPADDKVSVEIPSGAVAEPLRATATSLTTSDLDAIGAIGGFRTLGGFHLTLQRATEPPPLDLDGDGNPDVTAPPELFVPARATFTVDASRLPSPSSQVILAELLDTTPYGRMVRLAVPMMPVDATQTSTPSIRFTTKSIDRSVLAVDGVAHEGRYVLLAAETPIAFVTGTVRFAGANGRLLGDARVITPALGVAELTRADGIYNIPVPARPAAPFSLVPRHTSTGDGAAYTHPSAVDPDAVVRVDLALVPQPPVLSSVVVLKGDPPSQGALTSGTVTRDVAITTNIRASFSPSIDPASVNADSIIVTDALTGAKVSGSAAADGSLAVVWTLTAGERFKPNGRYIVALSAFIRGANGASLSRPETFTFTTVAQILNSEIHRERIRITIPGADGVSKIVGDPGALPAGWQAVAVRRRKDFIVRYQATAAGDGSFAFFIGNGGDAADKVTIGDLIDLQVISNVGNVAAIFALGPFASEDGKSFVVPAGAAVRYSTPEGLTLDVPEGAFDVPTVISVNAAQKQEFLEIPSLEAENEYVGSVRIDFEGTPNKPLMFEAPVPPGFDTTGKEFILAEKVSSTRGPRLAVIDLLHVDGGKFTTKRDAVTESKRYTVQNLTVGIQQTLTGSGMTKYLRMLMGSGIYMYLDFRQPVGGSVGWAVMESLQGQYDLVWDIYASYIVPYTHVFERGGALLPIVTGKRFTVSGIDPGTGLQAFSRTYDPLPVGPPGTVFPIPPSQQNDGGPYPVFGGPFRVEILDLEVEDVEIRSIRNFEVRIANGNVTVGPGTPALDADTKVELLNVSRGTMTSGTADSTLTLGASLRDRIVLLIEEHEVESSSPVSVVFNEPIYTGASQKPDDIDLALHELVKVAYSPRSSGTPSFADVTAQVRFTSDSGGRRITIGLPSALQSEALYRVTLSPQIADIVGSAPGLTLGQGTTDVGGVLTPVGGGNPLQLFFDVRKPAGDLATFTATPVNGLIRGMDLSGNLLFVAAWDGGLLAYDMSNPAALGGASPAPIASVPGPPNGTTGHLAVTIDRHNRVYTTAQIPVVGMFRSYRVEDFAAGLAFIPIKGSKIINWKMGYSNNIGLPSNTILSDVPESIPFRIKVLLQDDETSFQNRQEFIAGTGAVMTKDYPDQDLQAFTLTLGRDGTPYRTQRLTVENLSLDMRWSADATDSPAIMSNIIARSGDKLRLLRNQKTFAVVAHLGYGIGIYDANAIESNRAANLYSGMPRFLKEQLILTAGKIARDCPNATPDYGIIENYLTTDAELRGDAKGNLFAFFSDNYRGVLDLQLRVPSTDGAPGTRDDDCEQRPSPNTGGLLFRSTPPGNEVSRIQALKAAFVGAAGREPYGNFGNLARFHWSVTEDQNKTGLRGFEKGEAGERDYLLVAGNEYGLIIVDVDSDPPVVSPYPLLDDNVADVIWVPGGVTSVRVYQSANVALVGDRFGRAVLIDLSRIDERWGETGKKTTGLFPTALKALSSPSNEPYGVGVDDPRILWKSETGVVGGSVAPVFDPYTGMVFASNMQKVKVLSALDPRVQVKVNLGDSAGLSEVGGIVPLGIAPPQDIQQRIDALPACNGATLACKENASLAAFRLEVALPGNMADSLTQSNNELQLALESERIAGAITEQTPDGFPRAHLRRTRRDGSAESPNRIPANFKMRRIVPEELRGALKMQRGYNRFISPWIVAIADPRASKDYDWNNASKQQKEEAGCEECDRPKHLQDKGEADGIYELWTNGRFIAVRPELASATQTIFGGTPYQYLGAKNRLLGRFSTIMADTVRPTEALVAAQNPPVASGMLQETLFLHSGELQSSSVDFNPGGRAGFDVMFDRTYRSRTIGGSVIGQGWDSSLFRRLRALPNGDVEYRDGAEVWRFRVNAKQDGYDSPKGLFLKLTRSARGWKLIDQSWRVSEFDDLGRLLSEADEFFDPSTPNSGNIIRYVYDETGRLSDVTDPVQRRSTLSYWKESEAGQQGAYPGLVKQIVDWRDRKIDYRYDAATGTLTRVQLPDVGNPAVGRPAVQYAYTPSGADYNDILELRTNLLSITDPQEVAAGGPARVTFGYGSGASRDHVVSQQWGTGEDASFTYNSATDVTTIDVPGQTRKHTLTLQPRDYSSDRAHILSIVESGVPTSGTQFGQLPGFITPTVPATTPIDRTSTYTYYPDGLVDTATLNGVRSTKFIFKNIAEAPGPVLVSSTTTALGGSADPIVQAYTYQSGPNRSTFLAAVSANGMKIEAPEPSRSYKSVQSVNDSISSTETYDSSGLLRKVDSSGGIDPNGAGADTQIEYNAETDPARHQRALATEINVGGLKTAIQYPTAVQTIETDPRGIITTTDYDAWERPIRVTAVGPQMTVDERFQYDATGRLRKHIRKQGSTDVTTNYDYDVVGRRTEMSVDNIANAGTITTKTKYDLKSRTIVTDHPGGSRTTVKLDSLGRTASSETTTGGIPITDYFAYDLDDNLVFRTDLLTASASAYDAHGRMTGAMGADGTEQTTDFDSWGQPKAIRRFDTTGAMFGESTLDYTDAGRLRSVSTKVDSTQSREVGYAWDGGGRTTGMSESGRATHSRYDTAGRMLSGKSGSGDALDVATTFTQTDVSNHAGALPQSVQNKEKTGSAYQLALEYNTAGDITTRGFGGLEWKRDFDQAGNVTSAKGPNRPAYAYDYDSRGSLKQETLPGGAINKYDYHATGALTDYRDPGNEVTQTVPDLLGRPLQRTYKDGTQEKIEWEGRRVKSITDRQGRLQSFNYNNKGQIETIAGQGGVILDRIDYDAAGRIIRWTNDDAVVEYADFDFDGHPRRTTQSRYRNTVLIDQYTQEHTWNAHGERSSWTMPAYTGFATDKLWTKLIAQEYDAMGNIVRMQRTFAGQSAPSTFLDADYRNAGRPNQRTITTPSGAQIQRDYGYEGNTSQLNRMAVTSNGSTVAGSSIIFDGLQKSKAALLGLSGGARLNRWDYDDRSRLQRTTLARESGSTPQTEDVTVADFRSAFTRPPTTPVDPPSVVFRENPSGGHKIDKVERGLVVEQFTFTGGERTEDGKYVYQYDVKGRLTVVTDKSTVPPTRRVLYFYDGNDRLVGRRTEYVAVANPAPSDWKLEDRPSILSADGLPADTTFVWDPISDRVVSLYKAGASLNPTIDANGGLLRQIIHGGAGYDDPLEVTTVDVSASSGVGHLYPVYDEAGAGSLQAILNVQGQVVSRNLAAGPYGEDETVLLGAAVDKVSIKAKKAADGTLAGVDVILRATEQIAEASVATGVRLATVNASGAAVRTSSKTPTIVDESTVQWSLTAAEWNALIDPSPATVNGQPLTPAALSIAATSSLRASGWNASLPFLPAPAWAVATKPVYTSAELPVEVRESLANLAQWLASIGVSEEKTNTLYDVPNLLALGAPRLGSGGAALVSGDPQLLIVASGFHAHPFQDPMTGKNYVRARWFDGQNGVWLTPDPAGYRDSSNLYAYVGADPVNGRDSSGMQASANASSCFPRTPYEFLVCMIKSGVPKDQAFEALERSQFKGQYEPKFLAVQLGMGLAEPGVNLAAKGLEIEASFTGIGAVALLLNSYREHGVTWMNVIMTPLTLMGFGEAREFVTVGNVAREANEARNVANAIHSTVPAGASSIASGERAAAEARFVVDPSGVVRETTPLAKPGEDLFVGTYREASKANRATGAATTHTAHHAVADAISPVKTAEGITINIQKRLHELTRTYKRNPVRGKAYDTMQQLEHDVEDLRRILKNDGYDLDTIERALNELVRQNVRKYNLR